MGNHYYIISEDKFHQDKTKDPAVWKFVEGTGIDLNSESISKIPSVADIRKAITDFGLNIKSESREATRLELNISDNKSGDFWLIFTDMTDENENSAFMFEIGRGSNYESVITFIKFLNRSFGNFLFYCDSGSMSLITPDKDFDMILNEMSK